MTIDAQQEKEFYDHAYATHLAAEEGALACNREILERQFDTPTDPMYERRKLYKGVLDALLKNLQVFLT